MLLLPPISFSSMSPSKLKHKPSARRCNDMFESLFTHLLRSIQTRGMTLTLNGIDDCEKQTEREQNKQAFISSFHLWYDQYIRSSAAIFGVLIEFATYFSIICCSIQLITLLQSHHTLNGHCILSCVLRLHFFVVITSLGFAPTGGNINQFKIT